MDKYPYHYHHSWHLPYTKTFTFNTLQWVLLLLPLQIWTIWVTERLFAQVKSGKAYAVIKQPNSEKKILSRNIYVGQSLKLEDPMVSLNFLLIKFKSTATVQRTHWVRQQRSSRALRICLCHFHWSFFHSHSINIYQLPHMYNQGTRDWVQR